MVYGLWLILGCRSCTLQGVPRLGFGVWGVGGMVDGSLLILDGFWFMVEDLWFMVYGLWFMVYGLWFMVYVL